MKKRTHDTAALLLTAVVSASLLCSCAKSAEDSAVSGGDSAVISSVDSSFADSQEAEQNGAEDSSAGEASGVQENNGDSASDPETSGDTGSAAENSAPDAPVAEDSTPTAGDESSANADTPQKSGAEGETKPAATTAKGQTTTSAKTTTTKAAATTEEPEEIGDSTAICVEKVTAKAGEKEVAVSISIQNNPGFSICAVTMDYDGKLTAVERENDKPQIQIGNAVMGYMNASAVNPDRHLLAFTCASTDGTESKMDDVLFTVYFDVPADAASGTEFPITLRVDSLNRITREDIPVKVVKGGITVK